MLSLEDTLSSDEYDEFGLLYQNAAEWGIPFTPPVVSRGCFALPSGQRMSYLRWGEADPEFVFLHGGAQNAHTWDTVMLALGRSALAIDLPGHGHSDRRTDHDYGPWQNAEAVAMLMESVAQSARCVIGMSLGGATTIRLAAQRPDLCERAVIVDVTPQINDPSRQLSTAERGTVSLIAGPPVYESFNEMADAAVALSRNREPEGVRRGVRHNARRLDDGRWVWRYDLFGPPPGEPTASRVDVVPWVDFTPLWDDVTAINVPVLFVRGGLSPFVRDDDISEMRARLRSFAVEVVEGAGHAVQSDRPLVLAELIRTFAL
jgi:pimeloyl-ACP methyl ester carboxylesterase